MNLPVDKHVLSNGLTVLLCEKKSAPVVAVQVWYRTGSVNEHDGIRGISHFFEHMMFRGSAKVAPEEHARRINAVGGHCNAFTAEDVTAYINSVPKAYTDMVLGFEADRMRSLLLTAEILETERKVVIEEFHTYMNNPVAKAFLEFRKDFYGAHPYAVSPLGTEHDIASITIDDCRSYYERWYQPSNALLVITGDFGSGAAVMNSVETCFGNIQDTAARIVEPDPGDGAVTPNGPPFMTRAVEFDVPILLTGYPAPPSSHPDAVALEILMQIVSQGETSRMHREIVRKKSLAVMTGGMNHLLRRPGMSMFFAAFTPDIPARRVETAINAQIRLILDAGITAAEMEKVKNTILANRLYEMYSAEHICQRLGYAQAVEGDYNQWTRRLAALERIDRNLLSDVARRYWDESRKRVLCLRPRRVKPLLFAVGLARRVFGRFM